MIRITPKERAIIGLLVELKKKDRHTVDLGEIGAHLYDDEFGPQMTKPENWRQSLSATLRNLGWKASRRGASILRTSKLGRGNEGTYEFKGNIENMIIKKEASNGLETSVSV